MNVKTIVYSRVLIGVTVIAISVLLLLSHPVSAATMS